MKKKILFCIIIFALFGITACQTIGSFDGEAIGSIDGETIKKTVVEVATKDTTEAVITTKAKALDGISGVAGKDIMFNYFVPERRETTTANSIVLTGVTDDVVALTYDKSNSFSGKTQDVLSFLNDGDLFVDISGYVRSGFMKSEQKFILEYDKISDEKVAGLDTTKFVGSVVDANGKKCYAYGYAFVIDETPCMLVGLVLSETQGNEEISAINKEIDQMILTVREE